MRYLSVCSGIEAATVAWHPLGWTPIAFSEIEAFPCAVLAHYYPSVPNLGDMTKFQEWPDLEPDVLVGGTPCQSFSVAGLRKGLHDPRGNLMLTYLAIANRYRPKWLVWENVPGVLSSNGGRDFAALLRGLDELGYGWAYRVLDAQYYGVAQRRRRVFVVGHLGNWQRAAAVLFERSSLSGHPAPSREAGQTVAPCLGDCSNGGGTNGPGRTVDTVKSLIPQIHAAVSPALKARDSKGPSSDGDGDGAILVPMIPHSLRANHDAGEDGHGRGTPLAPIALHNRQSPDVSGDVTHPLGAKDNGMGVIAFDTTQLAHPANRSNPKPGDPCHTLAAGAHAPAVAFQDNYPKVTHASASQANAGSAHTGMSVRRLTAEECEFLQGFSRGYTLIPYRNKPAADGPRYKALGNSMAVPVMAWIGRRIQMVAAIGDGND
jgi:DNA (cytosine-5)-methyltransferase 1